MALTAYKRNIAKAVSGNLQLFLIKKKDINTVTFDVNGNIDRFNIIQGYEIQGDVDSVQFTSEGKSGINGTTFVHKMIVKMLIGKQYLIDLQAELNKVIADGICFIRTDANKNCFVSGFGLTDLNNTTPITDYRYYRSFETKYDSGTATNEDGKQVVEMTFTANMISNEYRFDDILTADILAKTYINMEYA